MIAEVNNISKSFDDNKVLDKVSFNLEEGNITGLVGRNGSGKTTLLKILAGIYNPDAGNFKLAGSSLATNPRAIEQVAYLPDRFDYFNFNKVKDIPEYYEILYPNFDAKFFTDELDRYGINMNQSMRSFSKGEKNLIGLITVLSSNAKVILIDEILDGMDVLNKRRITEYLLDARDRGCAIFASSHELAELGGICDNILYLSKKGKISSTSESENQNLHKLQVVVKESLPAAIANRAVIISNIGRVYTLLVNASDKELIDILNSEEIVQYDKLDVRVEDYFYLEEGARR